MRTDVIVLNGGSSAGKTSIARRLQAILPEPWLRLGVDTLVEALPPAMQAGGEGIEFSSDGAVSVGPGFRTLESAWMQGVAAMARTGARIILDEVLLGGVTSQERYRAPLEGLEVLWVGVHCQREVATRREVGRSDRIMGMAASQAEMVHDGVAYDVEVDTTHQATEECARIIAAQVP